MARIYSENQINGRLDVPNLRSDLCPAFKNASALTHHAQAIQHAMTKPNLTIQLEPGEEFLVMTGMKARVIWPTGQDVDTSILFNDVDASPSVTVANIASPGAQAYVKLDMSAPTQPAAAPVLMCETCGIDFDGKMAKARYAKHRKGHQE